MTTTTPTVSSPAAGKLGFSLAAKLQNMQLVPISHERKALFGNLGLRQAVDVAPAAAAFALPVVPMLDGAAPVAAPPAGGSAEELQKQVAELKAQLKDAEHRAAENARLATGLANPNPTPERKKAAEDIAARIQLCIDALPIEIKTPIEHGELVDPKFKQGAGACQAVVNQQYADKRMGVKCQAGSRAITCATKCSKMAAGLMNELLLFKREHQKVARYNNIERIRSEAIDLQKKRYDAAAEEKEKAAAAQDYSMVEHAKVAAAHAEVDAELEDEQEAVYARHRTRSIVEDEEQEAVAQQH